MTVTGLQAPRSSVLHRPYPPPGFISVNSTLCGLNASDGWNTQATGPRYTCVTCNQAHARHLAATAPWAPGETRRYSGKRHPGLSYFAVEYGDGNTRVGYAFRLAHAPSPLLNVTRDARAEPPNPWRLTAHNIRQAAPDFVFARHPVGHFPSYQQAIEWAVQVQDAQRLTELLARAQEPHWTMSHWRTFLPSDPGAAPPILR